MSQQHSPLRSKSRENRYAGYHNDNSGYKSFDKENTLDDQLRQRSKSPNANASTRQYQYQSRFGITGQSTLPGTNSNYRQTDLRTSYDRPQEVRDTFARPLQQRTFEISQERVAQRTAPPQSQNYQVPQQTQVQPRLSQHQEFFITELQNDIAELKNRQRDFGALKDQYRYLESQYKQVQVEKQKNEQQSLDKISQDRQEIDRLIRELDQVKQENITAEDEQIRVLETIFNSEQEVAQRSSELAQLRSQAAAIDQQNVNERKEIEYQEKLVNEQQDISHNQYNQLTKLRESQLRLDKELDQQGKRISILNIEIDNNNQRTDSINQLVSHKEEQIANTCAKLNEAHATVQDQKYTLNKLDGELGYLESQNEQHKNAQTQLFKANEYEYINSKEYQLKEQELLVVFKKAEQDEQSVAYEIDRLKQHSEQMYKDQIELQAEVGALDKHMANLNNQNYCLQKELEGFIEADDQVRKGLDRKAQVEQIRNKVDDVIKRSQYEVAQRVNASSRGREVSNENKRQGPRAQKAGSPLREKPKRQAFQQEATPNESNQSYNFSAINNERASSGQGQRREYSYNASGSQGGYQGYSRQERNPESQQKTSYSPLREDRQRSKSGGKAVKFAS